MDGNEPTLIPECDEGNAYNYTSVIMKNNFCWPIGFYWPESQLD